MEKMDIVYIVSVFLAVFFSLISLKIVYRKSIITYIGYAFVFIAFEATIVTYIYFSFGMIHAVWIVPLTIGIIVTIAWALHKKIRDPLREITEAGKKLAQKDISFKIIVMKENHELGDLTVSMSTIIENLHLGISEIVDNAGSLTKTADTLTKQSDTLLKNAEAMTAKSGNTASASEGISLNLRKIASSVETASTNLDTISSAAEEMSSTITEISQNAAVAKQEAESVVNVSNISTRKIQDFERQAEKVGEIITAINEISEQTKLLGLNATIEAARAGDAGKGFAVVASEVQELARQSTESAATINILINELRSAIQTIVADSRSINGSIVSISDVINNIASSVEEQSVTTRDIAQNITLASAGISEASQNISRASDHVQNITNDTVETNDICGRVSEMSRGLNSTALNLSGISKVLHTVSSEFQL